MLTSEFKTKNAKDQPFPGVKLELEKKSHQKNLNNEKNLPTQNLGDTAVRDSQLTRDYAGANAHCRHFDNFVANVIRQRSAIDEDAAELIDATLAGINETLKEETVYIWWVVDYYDDGQRNRKKKETTYSANNFFISYSQCVFFFHTIEHFTSSKIDSVNGLNHFDLTGLRMLLDCRRSTRYIIRLFFTSNITSYRSSRARNRI